MPPSFPAILLRLVENGFAQEALGAASACRAAYWDELLWDHLAHVRSRKQYAFASAPRNRTRVMEAASRGRMDRLSWLLERRGVSVTSRGPDSGGGGGGGIIAGLLVSAIDFSGRSALHYALEAKDAACAELLVGSGAYMFARDSDRRVPIEMIYSRAVGPDLASRVTDMAVSGGCSVDRREMHLMLKLAFLHGHVGCVASLVGAGLQLERKNASDETPMWYDDLETLRYSYADAYSSVKERLSELSGDSYVSMLRILMDAGKKRDAKWTISIAALLAACLLSDEKAVVFLLESKLLPSRGPSSYVFRYVFNGRDRSKFGSIARHLVETGVEIYSKYGNASDQPLWFALSSFSSEGVRVLIDAGAIAKFGEKESLCWLDAMYNTIKQNQSAAEGEVLEVLQLCIDAKLHEGPSQAKSMTSLLGNMCRLGYSSCVRLLLEAGASATSVNNYYPPNPLRKAYNSNHDDSSIIQLLFDHGACDDNENARSPGIQVAAEKNHPQIVRALLEKGSPLYTPDVFKSAVVSLLGITGNGNFEIIRILFDAWRSSVGDDGELDFAEPLCKACRYGRVVVASYILDLIPTLSSVLLARALEQACECTDAAASVSLVRMLLSSRGDPSDNKALSSGLYLACHSANVECMRLLLEADRGDGGRPQLVGPVFFYSLLCGNSPDPVDALNLLLDRVTDYDTSVGRKAFLGACSHGSYRCVEALLRVWRPADDDAEDEDEDEDDEDEEGNLYTKVPIVLATNPSDARVLQLLLDHGYGRNAQHVQAALLEACNNCNVEAVRILLSLNIVKLSRWIRFDALIWAVLRHLVYEQNLNDVHEILELFSAHGLSVKTAKIDFEDDEFISLCNAGSVFLINELLSRSSKLPRSSLIAKILDIIFDPYERTYYCDYKMSDTIATLRATGADTDNVLVKLCAKRESADSRTVQSHAEMLIQSGVNVDARKKAKPVIYLLAANHYDPVLVSLMLQGGARFDEEALVKCVPRESRAELRSLIAHFGVANLSR